MIQARVAVPAEKSRGVVVSWTSLMIVTATILRLVLIPVPSHGYDSFAYKHWTWRLVHEPLQQFYVDDGQAFPDHLPGDLWLFKLLGSAIHFINPEFNFYGPIYGVLISLMAISFDAVLAITLVIIGRAIGRDREGALAATAYWCAPAPIFVASVWGQIDGFATALAVLTLGLAIMGRFQIAFLVLTLCVVVKPQYGMLAMPLLIGWWHLEGGQFTRWFGRMSAIGIVCVGILALLSAPFGVSLVGGWGQWSLLERIRLASDTYTVTTLGAHNIWILSDPLNWPPDDRIPWLLGFSRHAVGMSLFAVCVLYALWLLIARWRGAITMVLASNVMLFGFFLFMTRMHERYLFPVVALSILLAMMERRYTRYSIVTTWLVFLNIALRFAWTVSHEETRYPKWTRLEWLQYGVTVQILAMGTLVVFGWLVIEASRKERP